MQGGIGVRFGAHGKWRYKGGDAPVASLQANSKTQNGIQLVSVSVMSNVDT
jgi:hypothetical protein